MGSRISSEIWSRPKNRARLIAAATSVPRTSASTVEIAATFSDRYSGGQMSARFQATREPLRGQAGRRELVGPLLGREGVEEDQQDRQVQEQKPRDRRQLQPQRRARSECIERPHAVGEAR